MSILQKAIQHDKQRSADKAHDDKVARRSVSGCYGIDNLFADKSKKLSFVEFWAGLKDIFLGCLILVPKTFSAIFSIIKRPGCALILFCTLILCSVISFTRSMPKQERNIAAVSNAKFTPITDDTDELVAAAVPVVAPIVKKEVPQEPAAEVPISVQKKAKGLHFSRSFESKVHEFFSQHKVSNVMCKNGHCLVKINNDVFRERSTLCEYPKIVIESPTEDELVFSDGSGNYCAIKIDALF